MTTTNGAPAVRSGLPEDQRRTVRVVVRVPQGFLARLDTLRGAVTRSAFVAWLLKPRKTRGQRPT